MNISYHWLRELTGTEASPQELRDRLTMCGLAVDAAEEKGDDYVLDVEVPSNRPDCLSHLGIAREVALMEGGRVRLPEKKPARMDGSARDFASVEIRDTDLCLRYAARVVRGVKIGPSPEWLVRRLETIGQRAINNVADITNYVLHEQGQPLHAFDLERLAGKQIVVRRALEGEKLKTLDKVERTLGGEMQVIADAERAIALAGVMGGEETEISDRTSDVLIESAYFVPLSVRQTARALGLNTEASYRFERGADYGAVLRAQERCVELICEIAGGTATEDAIDVYPSKLNPGPILLRTERVEALTGLKVEPAEMERILTGLGLERREVLAVSKGEWSLQGQTHEELVLDASTLMTFVPPTWRADLLIEADLIEEIARHTGYERIATEIPPARGAGEYQPAEQKRRAMRQALNACGFDEAVNFSFIASTHDKHFQLVPEFAADENGEESFITLSNPIIEGATRMRPTLLPGLLDALRHNFNKGTRNVRLFETGRIFKASEERGELPSEREALALLATGGALEEERAEATRQLDFYDLKGALEAAVDAMKIGPLDFQPARVKHLREGQSASISLEGKRIGTIGRLDESLAASYKFRQPVYLAELDYTTLLEAKESTVVYTPLSRFPSVVRDVSLLVERRVTLADLLQTIKEQSVKYWRDAKLVYVYEGEGVPDGLRSVTLRMEYRADERTLRDEEVDETHWRLVKVLEEKLGAQIRG